MTEEEFQAFQARRGMAAAASGGPLRRPSQALRASSPKGGAKEYPGGSQEEKRPKYGNRRVTVDGHTFDSKHEAAVYQDLLLRVKSGELKTVLRQVGFDLPGGIRYFADFVAIDQENRATVYDAKSEATRQNRVYINKKKQLKACCGLDIVEV